MMPDPALARFRALASQMLGLVLPGRFDRQVQDALHAAGECLGAESPAAACLALEALDWTEPPWQAAIERLTVRETSFFRQRGWWDAIECEALRSLIAARRADGSRRLRCLSIGCASGDEPYSLAMSIDRMLGGEPGWTVEILGLDLCDAALDEARAAAYAPRALREATPAECSRWFEPGAPYGFRVAARLCAQVEFRLFNIAAWLEHRPAADAALGAPADLVMCRNVLIHLEPARQPKVAHLLGQQVADGGVLVVSPVEATAAWFRPLRPRHYGQAILFRRPLAETRGEQELRAPAAVFMSPAAPVRVASVHPSAPPPDSGPEGWADDGAGARLDRARRLADLGLFDEALRLCEQSLDHGPEAELLMALVCAAMGDLPAAEAAAARGLGAAPSDPAALYVHAIISLKSGAPHRARRCLAAAVRQIPALRDEELVARHLAIDAGQIRQASRRLGAASFTAPSREADRGRPC